ncbi:MAG: methionyl-tRNA formyltransferase [Firmicutes bacterium]|nr:methionyl-tRNA formyltransferase [Bacillota bacterium]
MENLIFMGTSSFAVQCLESLKRDNIKVKLVVTRPDRRAGRNKRLMPPPVKKWALANGIEVFQPEKVNRPEAIEFLRQLNPELFVVVAYGQILGKELLNLPALGCVNVHASLLPHLRGAAPIEWSLIHGFKETGITTMFMDEGLDTGDIILQASTPITDADTGESLTEKLAALAQDLLPKTVRMIASGTAPRIPQPAGEYLYAPMLSSADERIDWQKPAEAIANLVRALSPKPGAYCTFRNKRLKILRARVVDCQGVSGTVVRADKQLVIACKEQGLAPLEVKPEGKGALDIGDFINGYRIQEGELFQ